MSEHMLPVKSLATLEEFADDIVSYGIKCVRADQYIDQDDMKDAVLGPDGMAQVKITDIFTALRYEDGNKIPVELIQVTLKPSTTQDGINIKKLCDWLESVHGVSVGQGAYFPQMYDVEIVDQLKQELAKQRQESSQPRKIITPGITN